ncbi:enoyl-CoA hydratase/isomerase/3-hydroxyacyl-CoA dehydrogenase [Pseudooceanicola batsensis HTCC2597]|uniref:Enoyl-CoA hydratase/isomerase/3-hydroxyacyl-CoA dehydrogenase n=1 Tax=Pseudooceanicola batsensis (strain ATCC BAA-863 / DSM 15984 / KCTC 12145 / HTCC2597) TaxID=252305 RepID=A3TW42_PSEBH|nr:3-hydroxyacyl-CoA dehydrogenase NAD-binding domain-containing protein [Pseudooceanicola batsensis]EAQ03838.1 enoyl-CoA hydratase/isomerase/3-hydroxyacyl-CoA dehydrogenase [Pseudooceanicola batsensis HTCC2597]
MAESNSTSEAVSYGYEGDVALVCVDNPPVNATGVAVRAGLQDAFRKINEEGKAKAIALYCAGRTFIAGADIREFGQPPKAPGLTEVLSEMEQSAIPTVSIIHGTALGGGYETALATHARVGMKGAKFGLPEVLLGILPGAGGTQRLPRLSGIAYALDIAVSGRHVPVEEGVEKGAIDRVVEAGDPREIAIAMGQEVVAGTLPTRRTDQLQAQADDAAVQQTLEMVQKKNPHLINLAECVKAIAASTKPIDEGLAAEREHFLVCMNSPQRSGLIHAFFGERAVSNIPEAKGETRSLDKIGVIGGGTMGSGITTSCLMAGIPVRLIEVQQEGLDRGVATITKNLDGALSRGKMTSDKRDAALAMLEPSLNMEDLSDVDLVIEAVFEKMEIKKDIFGKLNTICKPGAILASNTSYLDIDKIAATTDRPQDVLGLHFFSPAHVMRLLEIVQGEKTAPDALATGFALAKKLKKVGVLAQVCDGFIGNRILGHYGKVISYLVLDGASPAEVDTALENFGMAMGPHKVGDLAGLDIGYMTRQRRKEEGLPADERYGGDIADRICEREGYGRKTGKGYYLYETGAPVPNPAVDEIIDEVRAEKGITPKEFTEQEIVDRYMTAFISEATRVVEDGTAKRPIDVDMVFLFGYGFPRFRGGPLHYADTIGAAELVRRIEEYAKEDPNYWQVPPLLRKMADDGTTFADMNS